MKIAVAGKLTRADAFKNLRTMGYPIISRWIDIQANDAIVEDKAALWDICLKDASDCDIFFLYLGDHDKPHFGTMLEMGHAMAAGAVVYVMKNHLLVGKRRYVMIGFIESHQISISIQKMECLKQWNITIENTIIKR